MIRIAMGSVHETYEHRGQIFQKLNSTFPVPDMQDVNDLVDCLRDQGIEAAKVLRQDSRYRIMEKLPGNYSFHLERDSAMEAGHFLAKLHLALWGFRSISDFLPVKEFEPGAEIIWGDINGGNICFRDGKPVGVVDYDTVTAGSRWYDISTACVLWPEEFTWDFATAVMKGYQTLIPIDLDDAPEKFRHYTLILHKKLSDAYRGKSHIRRPKKYLKGRLDNLDKTYGVLCQKL